MIETEMFLHEFDASPDRREERKTARLTAESAALLTHTLPPSMVKQSYPGHKASDKATVRHRLVQITRALVLHYLTGFSARLRRDLVRHLAGDWS